jgi:hypothetical protein
MELFGRDSRGAKDNQEGSIREKSIVIDFKPVTLIKSTFSLIDLIEISPPESLARSFILTIPNP